jgi:hypothetical protein
MTEFIKTTVGGQPIYIPLMTISSSAIGTSYGSFTASGSTISYTPEDELAAFERTVTRTLADGSEVELTLGELYEINKMGKKVEDMTLEEFKDALTVVRI